MELDFQVKGIKEKRIENWPLVQLHYEYSSSNLFFTPWEFSNFLNKSFLPARLDGISHFHLKLKWIFLHHERNAEMGVVVGAFSIHPAALVDQEDGDEEKEREERIHTLLLHIAFNSIRLPNSMIQKMPRSPEMAWALSSSPFFSSSHLDMWMQEKFSFSPGMSEGKRKAKSDLENAKQVSWYLSVNSPPNHPHTHTERDRRRVSQRQKASGRPVLPIRKRSARGRLSCSRSLLLLPSPPSVSSLTLVASLSPVGFQKPFAYHQILSLPSLCLSLPFTILELNSPLLIRVRRHIQLLIYHWNDGNFRH